MKNMTAKEIKAIRARLGLTQKQLADLLGVTLCTVGRWEANIRPCSRQASTSLRRLSDDVRTKQPA